MAAYVEWLPRDLAKEHIQAADTELIAWVAHGCAAVAASARLVKQHRTVLTDQIEHDRFSFRRDDHSRHIHELCPLLNGALTRETGTGRRHRPMTDAADAAAADQKKPSFFGE
jgi:hypothetical protein